MANWNILKQAITNAIKANDNQEITGPVLQNTLNNIVSSVGENATFAGIATPTTNPGISDGPVFYFATQIGVYSNFDGISINEIEIDILFFNEHAWEKLKVIDLSDFRNIKLKISEIDNKILLLENNANALYKKVYGNIEYMDLSLPTREIIEAKGGGTITNYPDEEDISSIEENGIQKLKFADRNYNPQAFSGKGYKILRKNWQIINGESKNILIKEMISEPNTIYEVRYDFDLNSAEITLPENCVLKFNGGKLENGTLVGDNTKVNCDPYFTIFNKIIIKGNFLIEKLTPQNFGAVADGTFDCSDIFKQLEELPYNVFIPRGLYKVNNLKIKNSKEWHFEASGSAHWFDENCAKILTSTGVAINGGPIIYNLLVKYNGNEVDISKRGAGISLTSHWAEIHRAFVSNFNVGILLGGTNHCDYTRLYNVNSWYNYYAGIKIDYSDRAQVNFISIFDCNSGSNGVDVHNKEVEPNITRGFGIYLNGGNSIYINNADVSSNECAGIYIDTPTTLQAVRGLKVSTIYAEHNKYCNIYYNNKENRSTFIDITNTYFYNDETDKYFKRDVVYYETSIRIPGIKFSNALPVQNHFNYGSLLREDTDYISQIPVSYVRPNTTYEIKIRIKAKEIGNLVLQNEYRGIKYTNSAFLITSRISIGPAQTLTISSTDISEYTFYIKTPPSDSAYIVYNTADYGVKYELIDIALKELPYSSGSSADRPATAKIGFMYFDTTIGKPIWKTDDTLQIWVDATGQRAH